MNDPLVVWQPPQRENASWNKDRSRFRPECAKAEIQAGVELFPRFAELRWEREVSRLQATEEHLKIGSFRRVTDAFSNADATRELRRCKLSPEYFVDTFCWIRHPVRGLIRFRMFDYQRFKVLPGLHTQQFVITRKFRQGGFSTLTMAYILWMALFETEREILVLSKSDREAKNLMGICQTMWDNLPPWLRCAELSRNKSQLHLETGSRIQAYTPKASRSFSISFLVIDEAGFIDGMDDLWADMFPTVSTGGQAAAVSTVNGIGRWYHKTWVGAERGDNDFTDLFVKHVEHPDYRDPVWETMMRRQLGDRRYRQEVLAEFLGSKDTYVPYDVLKSIVQEAESERMVPVRVQDVPVSNGRTVEKSLIVWEEPVPGRQYAIGADVGTGIGQDSDHSVVSVIDSETLRQVAEFGSNEVSTTDLAHVAAFIGSYYNTATICVEANSIGSTVLDVLVNSIFYEQTYCESPGKSGLTLTPKNRPVIMNLFHQAICSGTFAVKSQRLAGELTTWIWNTRSKRPEHDKGYHDDYIMAAAMAVFAREDQLRNAPLIAVSDGTEQKRNAARGDVFGELEDQDDGSSQPAEREEHRLFAPDRDSKAAMAAAIAGVNPDSLEEPLAPDVIRQGKGREELWGEEAEELLREFGW